MKDRSLIDAFIERVWSELGLADNTVTSYRLDLFASAANPATATPVATSDLGKPAPAANNDITVNRATWFAALAPGTYQATVSAISASGSSRSTSITFTR